MKNVTQTNTSEQKVRNLTLQDYYTSLPEATYPKTEFINTVATKCGVSVSTVQNWITGRTKPSNPEHFKVLSILTGINTENLWQA